MRRLCCLFLVLSESLALTDGPPRLNVGAPRDGKRHGRRALVDEQGRERLLRGVNIGVEWWADGGRPFEAELYAPGSCPPNLEGTPPRRWQWKEPPVCGVDAGAGKWAADASDQGQNDLAQIRATGFNVVRLAVSWSLIEPEPGEYSTAYLERIDQVVRWAREQDVWVFIDFHQDSYSYFVPSDDNAHGGNYDGAPGWACPADAAYDDGTIISDFDRIVAEEFLGHEVDRSFLAFEVFWQNRKPARRPRVPLSRPGVAPSVGAAGLQEHYIKAMAEVVKRYRDNPTVLGYEIMNEVRQPPCARSTAARHRLWLCSCSTSHQR